MSLVPMNPSFFVVVHGIDVVDVPEYSRMLNEPMRAQLKTTFTAQELEECGENERTAERLAGRFATKEAVLKALGLPFGDGVAYLDVETITGDIGAPSVVTHRKVRDREAQLGVQSWLVSTSHTSMTVVASVIGIRAAVAV